MALQADLMGAAACGVRNLLCLTGDDPKAGDQPETKAVFDVDSTTLTESRATCATRGSFPPDARSPATRFLSRRRRRADRPAARWRPDKLAAKIAAGARIRADPVLHGSGDRAPLCRAPCGARATRDLFLLVGIAPLRSAKSARWMQKHLYGTIIPEAYIERLERAADPAAEGERIAVELIEELAAIPASPGSTSWRRRTRPRFPGHRRGAQAAAAARAV